MRRVCILLVAGCILYACPFDTTLREYLSANFWLPFAKWPREFQRSNVRRISVPFAGMTNSAGRSSLDVLRAKYRMICLPLKYGEQTNVPDIGAMQKLVALTRADKSLTSGEREEVELLDAKIDMRAGGVEAPKLLESAKKKLHTFLRTAKNQAFRSEARGWLAYVERLLGNQSAAGKIYLDELNRNGSNLSKETILNSLSITYGYDGGPELVAHIGEYFDTAEHASFAIQLLSNPHFHDRYEERYEEGNNLSDSYPAIKKHLEASASLFNASHGGNSLALLAMRVALRMGDPSEVRKIAETVAKDGALHNNPDFNWMYGSALFLLGDYVAAERPLLAQFKSRKATESERSAAAYGLCGVYFKTGNMIEQLRFALWLNMAKQRNIQRWEPSQISNMTLYWAASGFDLNLLIEAEAPIKVLQSFVELNPKLPNIKIVEYALAVRLAREHRYEESAEIYQSLNVGWRAARMRKMASLYDEAKVAEGPMRQEALYRLAELITQHQEGIYFNDRIWGMQSHVFVAQTDVRVTRAERETLIVNERKLKDEQEERWQAFLILKDIVRDSGDKEIQRKAARLAIQCVRKISSRFGRLEELRAADIELSKWLRSTH